MIKQIWRMTGLARRRESEGWGVSGYAAALARCAGLSAVIGVGLACFVPAAAASLSARDVQIIAKVLSFLDPAPQGGTVAVLYAAEDSASKADAEAITALFGEGLASAGGTVTAKAIDTRLFRNGTGYVAFILAVDAQNNGTTMVQPHGLLSIAAADDLVRSGSVVMAVHSQPRVDITVNRAAAKAIGVNFTAAFGMLVHER